MGRHNREIFAITSATDDAAIVDIANADSDSDNSLDTVPDAIGVEAMNVIRRLTTDGPHDELSAFADIETDVVIRDQLQIECLRARIREYNNKMTPPECMLRDSHGDNDSGDDNDSSGDQPRGTRKRT